MGWKQAVSGAGKAAVRFFGPRLRSVLRASVERLDRALPCWKEAAATAAALTPTPLDDWLVGWLAGASPGSREADKRFLSQALAAAGLLQKQEPGLSLRDALLSVLLAAASDQGE